MIIKPRPLSVKGALSDDDISLFVSLSVTNIDAKRAFDRGRRCRSWCYCSLASNGVLSSRPLMGSIHLLLFRYSWWPAKYLVQNAQEEPVFMIDGPCCICKRICCPCKDVDFHVRKSNFHGNYHASININSITIPLQKSSRTILCLYIIENKRTGWSSNIRQRACAQRLDHQFFYCKVIAYQQFYHKSWRHFLIMSTFMKSTFITSNPFMNTGHSVHVDLLCWVQTIGVGESVALLVARRTNNRKVVVSMHCLLTYCVSQCWQVTAWGELSAVAGRHFFFRAAGS